MSVIRFVIDDEPVEVQGTSSTVTLLQWLRATGHTAAKEGCAEGDCGACTVVLVDPADGGRLRTVNSCLVLLPQVHGARVWTAAGHARGGALHPAQAALVEGNGSQCGYCTPGFVAALVEACHRPELAAAPPDDWRRDDQLCGNLCRCTGYRPIRDALDAVAGSVPADRVAPHLGVARPAEATTYVGTDGRFHAPDSLDGALALLAAHPDARLVAGATDLGLEVTRRHRHFPVLIGLDRVPELVGVQAADGVARLGAATRLTDIEAWSADALPVLHRMLRYFGSRPIKHRATLGGNLCTASPIGDLAPVLLALDATAVIVGAAGLRRVPMAEFFPAYRRTALGPGELLAAVEVPLPDPAARLGAYKVSRRRELDISAVSGAFRVEVADGVVRLARLAFGGVAPTPVRATDAEAALLGRPWDEAAVERAVAALGGAVKPIGDGRGSAWYRRTLAENLLRGYFAESLDRPFVPLPAGHVGTVVPPEAP